MTQHALILLTLLSAVASSAPAQESSNGRRPNIVFILVDDLGWADLGCYGNRFCETPHIDSLAAEGMRFTDAYAAAPVCSPTRASILTGQHPTRTGITDFIPGHWRPFESLRVPANRTQHLAHRTTTIAERLRADGYATGYFGKWHLGGADRQPADNGFDESFVRTGHWIRHNGRRQHLSEHLTNRALGFMRKHRDEPFLLYLSHYAVHIPLQAEEPRIEKYRQKRGQDRDSMHPAYAALIEHVDESVKRITNELEALDLTRDTVVVLYSDNGALHQRFDQRGPVVTSNAPLRAEKGTLYEGGIRALARPRARQRDQRSAGDQRRSLSDVSRARRCQTRSETRTRRSVATAAAAWR